MNCKGPVAPRPHALGTIPYAFLLAQCAPKAQPHAQKKMLMMVFVSKGVKKSMEGFGAGDTVLGGERRAISKAQFACMLPAGKHFSCRRRATPPQHS